MVRATGACYFWSPFLQCVCVRVCLCVCVTVVPLHLQKDRNTHLPAETKGTKTPALRFVKHPTQGIQTICLLAPCEGVKYNTERRKKMLVCLGCVCVLNRTEKCAESDSSRLPSSSCCTARQTAAFCDLFTVSIAVWCSPRWS